MKRIYLDSCALLAAFRAAGVVAERVQTILDDQDRELIVSDYLKIELLPKPLFNKRDDEVEFLNFILGSAVVCVSNSSEVFDQGMKLAVKYGLSAMDALHVSAAIKAGASEFFSTEKSTKPMFRVDEIKVTSLGE